MSALYAWILMMVQSLTGTPTEAPTATVSPVPSEAIVEISSLPISNGF